MQKRRMFVSSEVNDWINSQNNFMGSIHDGMTNLAKQEVIVITGTAQELALIMSTSSRIQLHGSLGQIEQENVDLRIELEKMKAAEDSRMNEHKTIARLRNENRTLKLGKQSLERSSLNNNSRKLYAMKQGFKIIFMREEEAKLYEGRSLYTRLPEYDIEYN
jgi:hypothetical protein